MNTSSKSCGCNTKNRSTGAALDAGPTHAGCACGSACPCGPECLCGPGCPCVGASASTGGARGTSRNDVR